MLFFAELVHQSEVTKDGDVGRGEGIHFAISGVAPPPPFRPTTLWPLRNTALAWRRPKCTRRGARSICYQCDCKV